MREAKYHLYLTEEKYGKILKNLICFKSKLHYEGRYADAVDDLIIKFLKAKRKNIRIN